MEKPYLLHLITSEKTILLAESNSDNIKDPCKRIQNPSREQCEAHGCLWDIYGDRSINKLCIKNGNRL